MFLVYVCRMHSCLVEIFELFVLTVSLTVMCLKFKQTHAVSDKSADRSNFLITEQLGANPWG